MRTFNAAQSTWLQLTKKRNELMKNWTELQGLGNGGRPVRTLHGRQQSATSCTRIDARGVLMEFRVVHKKM